MVSAVSNTPEHLRVGWTELFFDLVFVVVIAGLTQRLHGNPDGWQIAGTLGLLYLVWVAWFNTVALANLTHGIDAELRFYILLSMAGVAVMAVGIPTVGIAHSATFAVGYALARAALTPQWIRTRRRWGLGIVRPLLVGVGIAAGWLLSVALPTSAKWWFWGVLGLIDVGLFIYRPDEPGRVIAYDSDHLLERIGLFIMIIFGESVALLIGAIDNHPSPATWVVAGLGFWLICTLFWLYYDLIMDRLTAVLTKTSGRIGDLLGSGQVMVIIGLVGIAAGLNDAVDHTPAGHLPSGALWLLCGGVIVFTLGIISLSTEVFRRSWSAEKRRKRWLGMLLIALRGITVPILVGVFGTNLAPWLVIILLIITPFSVELGDMIWRKKGLAPSPEVLPIQHVAEREASSRGRALHDIPI